MTRPADAFQAWCDRRRLSPEWSGVGEGWIPILDRLVDDLDAMGWDRDLRQVKEKFGELRFYAGTLTNAMSRRIEAAEMESRTTCDRCGAPGRIRGRASGWLKAACDACAEAP